jgi:DNA-binding transcriptional ArsR family regulator
MANTQECEDDPENEDDMLFAEQACFCAIFSNPIRLRIMAALNGRELCVGDLAKELDLSLSAVSRHLQLMKDRRAVVRRREGQSVFYRVLNQKFLEGSRLIREGLLEELQRAGDRTTRKP